MNAAEMKAACVAMMDWLVTYCAKSREAEEGDIVTP